MLTMRVVSLRFEAINPMANNKHHEANGAKYYWMRNGALVGRTTLVGHIYNFFHPYARWPTQITLHNIIALSGETNSLSTVETELISILFTLTSKRKCLFTVHSISTPGCDLNCTFNNYDQYYYAC